MFTFRKVPILLLSLVILATTTSYADQNEDFRNVVIYPYHAAPYYSYPTTTGYGYHYSIPSVNAEYTHPQNDRSIVTYPDGPYQYNNYYKIGTTTCYQIAHRVICSY